LGQNNRQQDPTEQQASKRQRLRLYASDPAEVIAGLEARVAQAGIASRMGLVFLALERYGRGESLPPGMTDTLFRFLCVTAGIGLFDQLAEHDERCADLLVNYFAGEDKRMDDLTELTGHRSRARASQLIAEAIVFLWDALPERSTDAVPLDKCTQFPLVDLLKAPQERARALKLARLRSGNMHEAMRELARARWDRERARQGKSMGEEAAYQAEHTTPAIPRGTSDNG
jgi:hypothetical protein